MRRIMLPAIAALAAVGSLCAVAEPVWLSAAKRIDLGSEPVHATVDTDAFGPLDVESPGSVPRALVFLAADPDHAVERGQYARALVRAGAVAVTLDLKDIRDRLAAEPRDRACHYVSDNLKNAAEAIQRSLGLKTYLFPVVAGIGEGAPFAFIALAQAPANTLAGAVSLGFKAQLRSDRPYCPGPNMNDVGDGTYQFDNVTPLPAAWRVIASPANQEQIETFQRPFGDAQVRAAASPEEQMTAFVAAALDVGSRGSDSVADLPLAVIRPNGQARALGVILSGDGGWRDIDKSIGEWLADHGVAVVGIDSLRYFWSERDPKQVAADLEAIFAQYGREFGTNHYALVGYSFGADVLPFVWPNLADPTMKQVELVSLLGLGTAADFEITAEGFLGGGWAKGRPIKPALSDLPLAKTQCFYGSDEAAHGETSCTAPELWSAQRIETPGGHHFDGNYAALAAKILGRLNAP
jgi:type IV secretory pathway VirJ component